MEKYGIDNVRGGSYSKVILDANEIQFITKRIDSATDKCYKCCKSGHFAKDCNTITESSSSNIGKNAKAFFPNETKLFNCKYCNKEFATSKGTQCHENLYCKNKPSNSKNLIKEPEINQVNLISSSEKNICFRCGRDTHYINDCYAKTTINGDTIDDSTDEDSEEILVYCCSYCNKEFETLKGVTCHENLYCKQKNNTTTNQKCFKCGREGHFSSNCYATKHINGKPLS